MVPRSRHRILPDRGTLLVGADLHGNLEDFERLRTLLLAGQNTHLALLGDLVHGPSPATREFLSEPYDFDDRSFEVVEGAIALQELHPDRVHLVLGNHDHGHVGGPRTGRFYPDEVEHLERDLTPQQRQLVHDLFAHALLLIVAPCGVVMTHGSPDDSLQDLNQLDRLSLVPQENEPADARVLESWLQAYGQPGEVTARLLATLSSCTGLDLSLLVHGHDKDEEGYFVEGGNQVCPVIFGAPRRNKRYLRLDLAARYRSPDDLRDGVEICRLYGVDCGCGLAERTDGAQRSPVGQDESLG